jgi:hypothetical protein
LESKILVLLFVLVQHGTTAVTAFLEDVYESCAVRDRILQMADFDGVDVGTLP